LVGTSGRIRDARNKAPNRLANAVQFLEMVQEARGGLEKFLQAKSLGKNKASSFKVEIVDLDAAKDKEKAKGKGKAKKKVKKDESSDSDGDDEDADETGEKSKKKSKKGQTQWVQDIEKDNACDEHTGQACIVLPSTGKHYQLTMSDKSLWGMMMTQGHASTKTPPRQLRIEDLNPNAPMTFRSTKKKDSEPADSQSTPQYPSVPPPWYPFMGYPGPPFGGSGRSNMPSSDPIDELDDPTLFPRVVTWLHDLDNGPRGMDGHNFSQCAVALETNMFTRILQLEMMSNQELQALCPSMPAGTTSLLLQYARRDCNNIRKKESRRQREVRLQPKRYV